MRIRFWGVRGSLPVPGPETISVGGNTTCISVETGDRVIVFDAGTGIRNLGNYLNENGREDVKGCIFLSHYHWDHIQGLPFFAPAFRSENRFHLYGETKRGVNLHDILAEQMESPYFPITMDAQQGLVTFNAIEPGDTLDVSHDVRVRTVRLNHPGGAIGYRLETPAASLCIITDHEHPNDRLDKAVVEFARGATILVHEAAYDPEEKRGPKSGWGHSSWEEAALVAREADVGTLYLSHHEPSRTDVDLIDRLQQARKVFRRSEIATEKSELILETPAAAA